MLKAAVFFACLAIASSATSTWIASYTYKPTDTTCSSPTDAAFASADNTFCIPQTTGSFYQSCSTSAAINAVTSWFCTDQACTVACTAVGVSNLTSCSNPGGAGSTYVKQACVSSQSSSGTNQCLTLYQQATCTTPAEYVCASTNLCEIGSTATGRLSSSKTTISGNIVSSYQYSDIVCGTLVNSTTANPNPRTFTLDGTCRALTGTNTLNFYYKGTVSGAASVAASVMLLLAALLSVMLL